MPLYQGSSEVNAKGVYTGSTALKAVFAGSSLVWSPWYSLGFTGTTGNALDTTYWGTYLNGSADTTYLTIQSNTAGIKTGSTDGTYRTYAISKNTLATDDVVITVTLGNSGSSSNDTGILCRMNSDCSSFVYANLYSNKVYAGYGTRSGSTWTYNDLGSSTVSLSSGSVFKLEVFGTTIQGYVDGTSLGTLTSSSLPSGSSNRYFGFMERYSHSFFVNYVPFSLSAYKAKDKGATNQV